MDDIKRLHIYHQPHKSNSVYLWDVEYEIVDISLHNGEYHLLAIKADGRGDPVHMKIEKPKKPMANAINK